MVRSLSYMFVTAHKHGITFYADPPPPPASASAKIRSTEIEGIPHVFVNVSFIPQTDGIPNRISHYEIQIGSFQFHAPVEKSVACFTIRSSEFYAGMDDMPVISVAAMDMCNLTSSGRIATIHQECSTTTESSTESSGTEMDLEGFTTSEDDTGSGLQQVPTLGGVSGNQIYILTYIPLNTHLLLITHLLLM